MSTRKLVITADDFGFDSATNQTILSLLAGGQVTATTVMAVSPAAQVGATELGAFSQGLGLHFVLNSDDGREPWVPASAQMQQVFAQYPSSPATSEQEVTPTLVAAELEAQYQLLRALDLDPRRLDSHSGTLYGLNGQPFIAQALQFCAQHGLGFRLPRSLRMYFGEDVPEPLRQLHAQAVAAADQLGVPLPEEMATSQTPSAKIPDYESLRDEYLALLPQFPDGTSELFLHPSADTDWARQRFGRAWQKRVWELRLLQDPVWWEAVAESGIELTSYWGA